MQSKAVLFVFLLSSFSAALAQDESQSVPIIDLEPSPAATLQPAPLPATASPAYTPLTLAGNFQYGFDRVFTPGKFALFAAKAAMDQERRMPEKWDLGTQGFDQRWADHFGRALVRENLAFAVRALDGEDPRYERSGEGTVWKRSRHAIAATFMVRGHNGQMMFAYSKFIADYGTPLIAAQWEPYRFSIARAVGTGTGGIGFAILSNVGMEFWPDIRRRFLRR